VPVGVPGDPAPVVIGSGGSGGGGGPGARGRSRLLTLLPAAAVIPIAALGATMLWGPVGRAGQEGAPVATGPEAVSPAATSQALPTATAAADPSSSADAPRESTPSEKRDEDAPSAQSPQNPAPPEKEPTPSEKPAAPRNDPPAKSDSGLPGPWECRGRYEAFKRSNLWLRPCVRLERNGVGYVVHARAMEKTGTGGTVSVWAWVSDADVIKYRDSLRKCRVNLTSDEQAYSCGPFTFTPPKAGEYHTATDTISTDSELPPTWPPQWTGTGSVSTVRWPP